MIMSRIDRYVEDPWRIISFLNNHGLLNSLSDQSYISLAYRAVFKKKLNLADPKTYNEKLQWLKLFDHNPLYPTLVDKYEVKRYVAEKIGQQYIVPTIGVWDSFDAIDFSALPEQFVLKCTHDSGGFAICRDRKTFDIEEARRKIETSLRTNYYKHGREWPYKNIPRRIIAEPYLTDETGEGLRDEKFFCFNGEPKVMFIVSDREHEARNDYFDMDYTHLPFENGHPNADKTPTKSEGFEEMKRLAATLSEGMPHVRVDFYCNCGKIYFGELTLYHWSGLAPFDPPSWDETLGSWIRLPEEGAR